MFKFNIKQEQYLSMKNIKLRTTLSKFRLSAHNLEIERGRFKNGKYLPPNQRLCKHCDLNICEDEIHFLLQCPNYTELRSELFTFCMSRNKYFRLYDDMQKFIWLLSSDDLEIINSLSLFIYESMAKRHC